MKAETPAVRGLENSAGGRVQVQSIPESFSQAESFDRVLAHALTAGICASCAAQVAWGAQNGFGSVRPPCDKCSALVRTFPNARGNGWRTGPGTLAHSQAWAALPSNSVRGTASQLPGQG